MNFQHLGDKLTQTTAELRHNGERFASQEARMRSIEREVSTLTKRVKAMESENTSMRAALLEIRQAQRPRGIRVA